MTKRLNVAVVGASISHSPDGRERFAIRAHLPALKNLSDRFNVVAVCTTRMETASETARHFDIPHAFDNVERMLQELPEIDAVCVCVRPNVQHKVVMATLRAGKHVYCEQPLGVSTAEARDAYELAESKGLRTVVGHQYHYEPAVLQMAEMIKQGHIGQPLSFNSTYFVSAHIAPRPGHRTWLFSQEASGRPGFRSAHSMERIISTLGDVTEVCADLRVLVPERANLDGGPPLRTTQVNNIDYILRIGDVTMGTLQICLTAWFGMGWGFQVYGTEGMFLLKMEDAAGDAKDTVKGDPKHGLLTLYGARVDMQKLMANPTAPELLQREFKKIPIDDRHIYVKGIDRGRATFPVSQMWHAFAQAIHAGTECAPSFRDVLKMHYFMDATEESMAERRWVKVDYHGLAAR